MINPIVLLGFLSVIDWVENSLIKIFHLLYLFKNLIFEVIIE